MSNKKYTKELLEKIVSENISLAGVIKNFGLKISGGNYSYIRKRIDSYGISTSHFLSQSWSKGKKLGTKRTKEEFTDHYLCNSCNHIGSHSLKLYLYEFGIKEEKCELCKISNIWNGEKLSLHLDHIDGDSSNNTLSNLRILCPNCHSQTETYAGKRNKITKEEKLIRLNRHCVDCDSLISKEAIRCKSCKNIKESNERRTFEIPSKQDLAKMIKETNFSKVAKNFNVSDNAVRKWCAKYGLSIHASDYKISP